MLLALSIDVGLNDTYPAAIAAWKAYAMEKYPEEACGFILEDGSFKPVANIHEDPINYFRISDEEFVLAGEVKGFLHSHTPREDKDAIKNVMVREHPSEADMETQMAMQVPWGISIASDGATSDPVWWGDSLPIRPLVGRPFIWGINDCYSLVRDWHRLQGLMMPDYPREIGFWQNTKDHPAVAMYEDLFESAGFKRVIRADGNPLPGDCFITKMYSTVRNHAGVYIGNGLILHHTMEGLSKRSPAAMWKSHLEFLVRHRDLPDNAELLHAA